MRRNSVLYAVAGSAGALAAAAALALAYASGKRHARRWPREAT